jgi:hypothetical protein
MSVMDRRLSTGGDTSAAPETESLDRRGDVCAQCLLGLYDVFALDDDGYVATCRCTLCDSVVNRYRPVVSPLAALSPSADQKV